MIVEPIAGEKRELAKKFNRTLYEQDFTDNGKTRVFSIWGYTKGSAALILPVTTDGNVVAIRQYRHGAHGIMLEVPGGLPSSGENPETTIRRELLEEVGYEVGRLIDLKVKPFPCAPSLDYFFHAYLGLDCVKVKESDQDPEEQIEIVLIPLSEWFQKVWNGEVLDGQMISLSMLALPRLAHITFNT
jgi:ADP-ribose pyrophosphatase